jgi:hypothetical protein
MLLWIVRDTRRFLNEWVSSHSTIATRTAAQALAAARKHALGKVEVVGYILNGRDRYFRPDEFIA